MKRFYTLATASLLTLSAMVLVPTQSHALGLGLGSTDSLSANVASSSLGAGLSASTGVSADTRDHDYRSRYGARVDDRENVRSDSDATYTPSTYADTHARIEADRQRDEDLQARLNTRAHVGTQLPDSVSIRTDLGARGSFND